MTVYAPTRGLAEASPGGRAMILSVHANGPPREGSQRESWYLYDVVFDGEHIITGSRDPECDAARALLARGIAGLIQIVDSAGKPRAHINVEKAAKLTAREDSHRGPRFAKWQPRPEMPRDRVHVPATAAETPLPGMRRAGVNARQCGGAR
jgi:hypothetical protein